MPIRQIKANISFLTDNAPVLILDADVTAAATTITVKSILGVAVNKLLLFREPGNEHAEIIATHATTAPSGNTVTLVSGIVESHPAGTKVYVIPYNQLRFFNAPTEVDANSDASTLVALAALQNIDPTSIDNVYNDTVSTSGYYYYRFSDSVNTVYSLYSDPIPWVAGALKFAENEVGYVLEFIRRKLAFEWSERFSIQTAIDETNACFRYIQGKLKHWSRYLVADYALGQTARGVFDYALPSNIYDNETNKSILQVKIIGGSAPLTPLDEKEFDSAMGDAIRTTVRTATTAGDLTLEVVNSYDFDDAGTVHVYTSNADEDVIYTAVTRSTTAGVFTGVPAAGETGAITVVHAVGTNVWQEPSEGEPQYFNVRSGRLRIWPMPSSDWINKNIYIDYNQEATSVDSESDTIDVPRYDVVKHWLLWKAKSYINNNGKDDMNDSDYLIFRDILGDAIRKEKSGQKFKMAPKLNKIEHSPRHSSTYETD